MDWDAVKSAGRIAGSILPWVFTAVGAHNIIYNRYPKYYFMIVRVWSKWRDTKWNVRGRFVVTSQTDLYTNIETALKNRYKGSYKRTINMTNKKLYECGNYQLMVEDDFHMGEHSIREVWFHISQLNVTLKSAEDYLRDLRELFLKIEAAVHPKNADYNLDVFFPKKKNPFYGLMIQRLGPDNITNFECQFPISTLVSRDHDRGGNQYYLRVFKDKICINESDFSILEETAKRALLLR